MIAIAEITQKSPARSAENRRGNSRPAQSWARAWLLCGCLAVGLDPSLAANAGPMGWWPFWLLIAPLLSLAWQRALQARHDGDPKPLRLRRRRSADGALRVRRRTATRANFDARAELSR